MFNSLLIVSGRYGEEYISYVCDVTRQIGGQMGSRFDEKLSSLPENSYKDTLIGETKGKKDIYENLDVESLGNFYIRMYRMNGIQADLIEKKYEQLQSAVDRLDDEDSGLSLSAAGMTKSLLDMLIQTVLRATITEAVLLAVLMALYAGTCEGLSKTAQSVYASRTGRRIQYSKYIASLISSLLSYLILSLFTVLLYAIIWNLGPVWNASISNPFYYVLSLGRELPFITWRPFTVLEYLLASIGLGTFVVCIFHSLSFGTALIMNDCYKGFLVLFLGTSVNFGIMVLAGNGGAWGLYHLIQWTPIMLWWFQPLWFTDINIVTVVPWQECFEALFGIILCIIFGLFVERYYKRKDIK